MPRCINKIKEVIHAWKTTDIASKCIKCNGRLMFYLGNCVEPTELKCLNCGEVHWSESREPMEIVERVSMLTAKREGKIWKSR